MSALTSRTVYRVKGQDTKAFLQGLLTQDMNLLSPGHSLYGAMLTPQGRILYDVFVMKQEEDFLLDAPSNTDFLERIKRFILRSKVFIEETDLLVTFSPVSCQNAFKDPRISGYRMYQSHLSDNALSQEDYQELRYSLGVAEGQEITGLFPLECGFEKLNGVSFSKGCYVGQEVTARMKTKGNFRKGIVTLKILKETPSLIITVDGKDVGKVLSRHKKMALGLLRRENFPSILMCGESSCTIWRALEDSNL